MVTPKKKAVGKDEIAPVAETNISKENTERKQEDTPTVSHSVVETDVKASGRIRSFSALLSGAWQIFTYAWKNYLLLFLASMGVASVFIGSFVALFITVLVASSGSAIEENPVMPSMAVLGPVILIGLLLFLIFVVVMAGMELAIDHSIYSTGEGKPEKPTVSLKFAFSNLGSLFLVSIISGLLIFGATLLFVIPGIIVGLMLSQIWPVFLLEGKRGMKVLSRSNELTKGHKWTILGLYALLFAIMVGVGIVTGMLSFIPLLGNIISLAINIIGTPIIIAFGYLIYKDLVSIQSQTKK